MALSVFSGSEKVLELTQTIDDEIGLHYGAAVDIAFEDELRLTVETPPQVARHAGYETAFLNMDPVTIDGSA